MNADLTLRKNIRAITDALGADEWIRFAAIRAGLPEPQPSKAKLAPEVTLMERACMLVRRGTRCKYEYRSGPVEVIDRRAARKGLSTRNTSLLGFRELARLFDENPAEFARVTQGDPLTGTAGVVGRVD